MNESGCGVVLPCWMILVVDRLVWIDGERTEYVWAIAGYLLMPLHSALTMYARSFVSYWVTNESATQSKSGRGGAMKRYSQ